MPRCCIATGPDGVIYVRVDVAFPQNPGLENTVGAQNIVRQAAQQAYALTNAPAGPVYRVGQASIGGQPTGLAPVGGGGPVDAPGGPPVDAPGGPPVDGGGDDGGDDGGDNGGDNG